MQGEQPLQVPAHRLQTPFATGVLESAQAELAKSHHRFNDPEDQLGVCLRKAWSLRRAGVFRWYLIFCIAVAESGGGVGAAAKRCRHV